jgi:exonuclease V gamma subunit
MAERQIPYDAWGEALVEQKMSEMQALADEVQNLTGGISETRSFQIRLPQAILNAELRLSSDEKRFVMWTSSEKKKAAVQLAFYLGAAVAAAAGVAEAALLACTKDLKLYQGALPEKEAASNQLGEMVSFYIKNRDRLLEFAPETSLAIANEEDGPEQLVAAKKAWEDGYYDGEGSKSENTFAWRARDPFATDRMPLWAANAKRLLSPVAEYCASLKTPDPVAASTGKMEPEEAPPVKKKAPAAVKPAKPALRGRGARK